MKKLLALMKTGAKWLAWSCLPLLVLFVVGEQVEARRLAAIAACETSSDAANCMRQRRFLAASPYYPDITRRVLGGYARILGGAMGASYAPPPPPDEEEEG